MNAFRVCHQIKLLIMLGFISVNVFIVIYYFFMPKNYEKSHNRNTDTESDAYDIHDFVLNINSERINKLFKIIHQKEDLFGSLLEKLNLIQFKKLVDKSYLSDSSNPLNVYKKEVDDYLEIVDNQNVNIKEKFVKELNILSFNYSFKSMHDKLATNQIKVNFE